MSEELQDTVNAGAGIVDVEAMSNVQLEKLVRPSESQQILNWIEDRLREGNIIYASDLEKNPLFEPRSDGTWKFHIVVQPLRGNKVNIGNESPE